MQGTWIWADPVFCRYGSGFGCFFESLTNCRSGEGRAVDEVTDYSADRDMQPPTGCDDNIPFGLAEFLFSRISPRLIAHAQREIENLLRRERFSDFSMLTDNMITIHIRYGDKVKEMDLVPIKDYVDAVKDLIVRHSIMYPVVYVMCDMPNTVHLFRQSAPHDWRVITYESPVFRLKNKKAGESANFLKENHLDGKSSVGSSLMVALLLGLQANYFVLTLASNLSRLINEIRVTILNVECLECTDLIDLRNYEVLSGKLRTVSEKYAYFREPSS